MTKKLIKDKIDSERNAKPTEDRMVNPTPEEAANGWDRESLTKYLEERGKAQLKNASKGPEQVRPEVQNSKFNPHYPWRNR